MCAYNRVFARLAYNSLPPTGRAASTVCVPTIVSVALGMQAMRADMDFWDAFARYVGI